MILLLEIRSLLDEMILKMHRFTRCENFSDIIKELYFLHDLLVYNFYEIIVSVALPMWILDIFTKILSKFTIEFISCSTILDQYSSSKMTKKTNSPFSSLFCLCSLCLHSHKKAASFPGIMFVFQVEQRGKQNINKCMSAESHLSLPPI